MNDRDWKKLLTDIDNIKNSLKLNNQLKALEYINEETLDAYEKSDIAFKIYEKENRKIMS